MNKKSYRKILLVMFVVFSIGIIVIPKDVAAYYEWYEYHTYSADDYQYRGDMVYWLHSEAVIRYHYREDNQGRIRLIDRIWYSVEHTCQQKSLESEFWTHSAGTATLVILRDYDQLWLSLPGWISYYIGYPGFSFQSGDQFRDFSTTGVYGDLINIITIP